jgi:putative nucleotidyltransferase with HDIG domain
VTSLNPRDAIARIKDLPTLPAVLGRILEAAFDPDASALELGKHIAADQALSARLLKIVNSPYYGYYRQINSITTAVVILGFVEIRNIVFTATAFQTIEESASGYDRTQLWRHSLASAIAAERCANLLEIKSDGAFVAGLLHDLGKVALDSIYPDEFAKVVQWSHEEQRPLCELEQQTFGLDHAEAGGLLAEHWNLPVSIVEAIRFHHEPEKETPDASLTRLTAMGNFLAYQAGFGEAGNAVPPDLPQAAATGLGLHEQQWLNVAEQVRDREEQIDTILGVLQG